VTQQLSWHVTAYVDHSELTVLYSTASNKCVKTQYQEQNQITKKYNLCTVLLWCQDFETWSVAVVANLGNRSQKSKSSQKPQNVICTAHTYSHQ